MKCEKCGEPDSIKTHHRFPAEHWRFTCAKCRRVSSEDIWEENTEEP